MKKLLLVFIIICSVFCLVSCHKNKKVSEFLVPSTFDESKHYDLTFWAKNDTNITQKKIYQKAIDDFCMLYPNISITLKSYNDYGKIYNDVITNISLNTTPNICISYPDHVSTYASGDNVVVKLDDLINDETFGMDSDYLKFDHPTKSELSEKFLDECKLNDGIYLLPFMRSSEALYVNKMYVEKLGFTLPSIVTWDFMFEVAKKAMSLKSPDDVLIPIIYKSTDNMMIQLLKQYGYDYSSDSGEILIFNDNTKGILKFVDELTKNKCFSTFKLDSYPGNFFNKNQCIFAIDSTAGSTWIGSKAPLLDIKEEEVVDFETAVLPVPQVDIDKPQMISQGPSLCIFNKEDKGEVLATWFFMQYLLSNDVQISYSQTEGYLPVTTKAIESSEYIDYLSNRGKILEVTDSKGNVKLDNSKYYSVKIDATKIILDNINNTFTTPVFNTSVTLRNIAGDMIEDTVLNARQKKEFTDAFYLDLVSQQETKIRSLSNASDSVLGPLPVESKVLLIAIAVCFVVLGSYGVYQAYLFYLKRKSE